MEIKHLGHSSFLLKGKNVKVITDPFNPKSVGIPFPKKQEADVVTVSHDHEDHNAVKQIQSKPFIISGPGEYEVKGVSIIGIPTFHDDQKGSQRGKNVIYRIEIDGIVSVHMGDLGHMLSSGEIELLDGVDVLMIPIGGIYTIDSAVAKQLISEIEPSIVIPMHYKTKDLNQDVFGKLSGVEEFLKVMDKTEIKPQPKLNVKKESIPEEQQVIILERP